MADKLNKIKSDYLKNVAVVSIGSQGWNEAKAINANPRQKTINAIEVYNEISKYFYQLNNLYKFKREIVKKNGTGLTFYNNPLQLLDRLELLGASISAGNNGVIPEFSEIAHHLAKKNVITKKQLNTLLKYYVINR